MKTHYSEKYLLLGATGYVGQAFATELAKRNEEHVCLSRNQLDYTDLRTLRTYLIETRPTFIINCAGYTGKPNVDACEKDKAGTILGNVVLTQTLANACELAGVPWGQVSSGCIYSGAKLRIAGQTERVEKNLMAPGVQQLWQADPSILHGFTEDDTPNFSFRHPPCSFYSGTKALSEELLNGLENVYQWRLRIPFDNLDNTRNYLTKVQSYERVYDNVNSLSHRGDFVSSCLALWAIRAPCGTYNITNPGWVTTRSVVALLKKTLLNERLFDFFQDDEDFYKEAATPRSNTVLDSSKLLSTGLKIRSVEEALAESLENWSGRSVANPLSQSYGKMTQKIASGQN